MATIRLPPFLEIDFEFIVEEVFGAACITFAPVSKFCPLPAKDTPVNSALAPSPFNILIGYSIDICEPKEPDTHSIVPFFSTIKSEAKRS